MQMLHSVGENSTVISTNAVGKQTMGARDCSGFPIVVRSDCDADTAVGDGGGGEEGGDEVESSREEEARKERKGKWGREEKERER